MGSFKQEHLIFIISPPRAGSTLLQRMLGGHPKVFTHPEPHMLTPLAHLGVYANVDKAPYDHINAAEAMKSFIEGLPAGEADYFDALRAYSDTLYGRMLTTSDKPRFLDKTPAYALILPFLERLYPNAKYIVLTRHPMAVFSSYANSFFDGDWERAQNFNPILERYVPAMARFSREARVPKIQVAYEDLVQEPEGQLKRIFEFLELEPDASLVDYAEHSEVKPGMGDPIQVNKASRPNAESLHKWAEELQADEAKRTIAAQMVTRLGQDDLDTWGWLRETFWEALADAGMGPVPSPVLNWYTFQRKIMLALKKDIDKRPHGKLVRKLKYYCDVLLRD